jgi:hypothetical protein
MAMRVIALLVGLEFSGVTHAAGDAVAFIVLDRVTHEDSCPLDGTPCDDCPSSCPNCHCRNAPIATPPVELSAPLVLYLYRETSVARPSPESPPSPDLPPPFRPPRPSLVAS